MPHDSLKECKFYQLTTNGKRCILLSPEEWSMRRSRLIRYCMNRGVGCAILNNYMNKIGANIKFMKKSKKTII